jgi:hypothetical protein
MKDLEFNDYSHTYQDDDGDPHTTTVRAAKVDKGHVTGSNGDGGRRPVNRYVTTIDGGQRLLRAGDVVVETSNPNLYDVHDEKAWNSTGYAGAKTEYDYDDGSDDTDDDADNVPAEEVTSPRKSRRLPS